MEQYNYLFEGTFGRYTAISPAAQEFLDQSFKVREFGPRQYISEAGKVERYFYIVVQGVQALYIISPKGEKVVIGFSFDGSLSGAYDSFVHERPAQTFVEAITPSRLLSITKPDYDLLFERFPEFKDWRMQLFEEILIGRLTREVELITLSARERFDAFMARCPAPLLTIPQKYLASYLNMKPETFSRLRAERF